MCVFIIVCFLKIQHHLQLLSVYDFVFLFRFPFCSECSFIKKKTLTCKDLFQTESVMVDRSIQFQFQSVLVSQSQFGMSKFFKADELVQFHIHWKQRTDCVAKIWKKNEDT
jgi:hypothetical protein